MVFLMFWVVEIRKGELSFQRKVKWESMNSRELSIEYILFVKV